MRSKFLTVPKGAEMIFGEPCKVCVTTYADDKLAQEIRSGITDVLMCHITNRVSLHTADSEESFEPHTDHDLCVLIKTSKETRWLGLVTLDYFAMITIWYKGKTRHIILRRKSQMELGSLIVGEFLKWVHYDYLGNRLDNRRRAVFTHPVETAFTTKSAATVQA